MALAHSPKIVTDGLVLCLDASDGKSYSGSGTTWTDRSGNGNNGTLINSPTFSNGIVEFDGADEYVNVADSGTLDGFSSVTFEAWVKPDNNSGYRRIYDKNYNNTYNFSISNTSTFYIYINGNYSISSTTVDNNQWNHIVATYDNTSAIFYKNGIVVNTNSFSHGAVGSNSADLRIGTNHDSLSSKFYGDMGSCKMYSKALTASEVLQNYNATKGRFS